MKAKNPALKKTTSLNFIKIISLYLFLILLVPLSYTQVDTTKIKKEQKETIQKMQDAQKKGLEQLKNMGIQIDPNKKMSKEDAKKLKEELLKSAGKMTEQFKTQAEQKHIDVVISKTPPKTEQIIQIADRFFNYSYKQLNAIEKSAFDNDYKVAKDNGLILEAVRSLCNKGSELITFGNNHNFACVYIAAAVKSNPKDTLCVNNFGGYLRIIDSLKTSITVLLYANNLFSQSPVILTQIGCSLLELGDEIKGEKYLKEALKYNPNFGQAHSALCEVYIRQNRLQDAIIELFAGVKGMGASYNQTSQHLMNIQMEYGQDSDTKEDFWNETKKQLDPTNPSDALAPLVPEVVQIQMPSFNFANKVEDWTSGGGQVSAMDAFQSFHKYVLSFIETFQTVHQEVPDVSENAALRDYPNERFALDCITEMFMHFSNKESKRFHKIVDDIVLRIGDAKTRYIENLSRYQKEYLESMEICTQQYKSCNDNCETYKNDTEAHIKCTNRCGEINDVCSKEAYRNYCQQQCPNANEFNSILRVEYASYTAAFNQMVNKQKEFLDDLYGFSNPWFQKIYSPYWSKIYAYEIRRVALSIIENTYLYYPQYFDPPINDECGSDCSVFSTPFRVSPEEVDKKNPDGNNCPEHTKFKIPLAICELGIDCESIEFGCSAIVAGSVKRNFKKKNTTLFVGVGVKGELGVISAGAKAGAVVVVNDNGEVDDVGGKMDVSVSGGIGAAKVGVSSSGSLTVMKGFDSKVDFVGGLGKPK
jgi:tetratricopeptide (TPR) repeat protein